MDKTLPIQHCRLLITRPQEQGKDLQHHLEQLGAQCFLFPTLHIEPAKNLTPVHHLSQTLNQWDYIIFTSANSVIHSLGAFPWPAPPPSLKVIAVGEATGNALAQYHWTPSSIPLKNYSSEGILSLPDFRNIEKKRIIIVKGKGGRTYLKKTLEKKKARVRNLWVYERSCPQVSIEPLIHYWKKEGIHYVITTSGEGLKNLIQLLGHEYDHYWKKTPHCVISERVGELAKQWGVEQIRVAEIATLKGITQTLIKSYGIDYEKTKNPL